MTASTAIRELSDALENARQAIRGLDSRDTDELGADSDLALAMDGQLEIGRRLRLVSGCYTWKGRGFAHDPSIDGEAGNVGIDLLATRDEIRLDVDGRYPQMTISGTMRLGMTQTIDWIARLRQTAAQTWEGPIWYKDGATSFLPFTSVQVRTSRIGTLSAPQARVTYRGDGLAACERTYKYSSPYFHPVMFEYDCAEGTTAQTSIDTQDHPDRPTTLPAETLSIEAVFRRAGFNVTKSAGDTLVPLSLAGSDRRWSDMEMHDAMQAYWSRFADAPQWSMWIFFASLHEQGTSLGGIMFDDIGPNHRQGTAIFSDSFISNPPTGDPHGEAWVRRMKFWTAVHESGHSFNLAHSWQKSLGTPWIPLADEPTALSFMNYPFSSTFSSVSEFFRAFEYRFSDTELLFLRHAPQRFVEMGNAAWFDHHGLEQELDGAASRFQLELRVNRPQPRFEYLEPVVVELKLKNKSARPQVVNELAWGDPSRLTIIIKQAGRPARQFEAFAHYCQASDPINLPPGESLYESVFVSAGRGGWEIAEPGQYTLQVACQCGEQCVVSNPLQISVAGPNDFGDERLAQDYFSDEVARILTFGGSTFLEAGNATLQEVVDQLPGRRVAIHARVALGNPLLRNYKRLRFPDREPQELLVSAAEAGAAIKVQKADPKTACDQLEKALVEDANQAAESLGHVRYRAQVEIQAELLAEEGLATDAAEMQKTMANTLEQRDVLPRVVSAARRKAEQFLADFEEDGDEPKRKRRK